MVPNPAWGIQHNFYYPWNGGTNLVSLGARNYDPRIGRFLGRDPR